MEGVLGAPTGAVGFVSGSMTFKSSMIEPGQPCVMSSGSACSSGERMCANWMSSPSISVTNCGRAFNRTSARRQS
jgi:hypothetical protein